MGDRMINPEGLKDTNPKTAYGLKKPDLFHVPFRALFWQGVVHLQGALKYGPFNWRKQPVSASTYLNAAIRHLNEWREGVERDKDSGGAPPRTRRGMLQHHHGRRSAWDADRRPRGD